jgi:hypothetical protein
MHWVFFYGSLRSYEQMAVAGSDPRPSRRSQSVDLGSVWTALSSLVSAWPDSATACW